MRCPHRQSATPTERPDRTALGYCRFRCRAGTRGLNERTGPPFNDLQDPTAVVCLMALWRVRYKLSLRDRAEMFLHRSMVCTHDAVREWERKLAPRLSATLRQRRYGTIGNRWYVDETYLRIQGQWRSLYRALERDGHLVDGRPSDTRDLAAAEACFRSAWTATGVTPTRITPDGHDASLSAIRTVLGDHVRHRTNRS